MSTLTATADTTHARTILTLDWDDVGSATIVRNDPDGRRVPVRDAEPLVLDGDPVVIEDIEVPLDAEVTYTATATEDATTLDSDPVTVASGGRVWLKHPGRPLLNITVTPAEPPERKYDLDATVMPVQGRRYPIVLTGGRRQAAQSALALRTATLGEADALRALLDDGSPLLLQAPAGFDIGSVWIQPLGLNEKWIMRYLPDTKRLWTLEYVTVDRPAGMSMNAIIGSWRWWKAQYESWAAARVDYPTWADAENAS